jgi:hypothetical protein
MSIEPQVEFMGQILQKLIYASKPVALAYGNKRVVDPRTGLHPALAINSVLKDISGPDEKGFILPTVNYANTDYKFVNVEVKPIKDSDQRILALNMNVYSDLGLTAALLKSKGQIEGSKWQELFTPELVPFTNTLVEAGNLLTIYSGKLISRSDFGNRGLISIA